MRKQSLLYVGFGLVVLLWALNLAALAFYFYWTLGWYDYMMHFLGGLALGILAIWFLKLERRTLKSFFIVFICVMAIGGAWEIFEYVNGITFSTEGYVSDTIHDLIMDAVGITFAYWWAISLPRESS